MNLVQKLPIGLSLACVMFMSSCSKEDAQTPEPKMESINAHSNAKTQGGIVLSALALFPPTTGGLPGINVYPSQWDRQIYLSPDNFDLCPTGSSSLTHLWGSPSLPWVKPLPGIPSVQNISSILTAGTYATRLNFMDPDMNKTSAIITQLKFLKPGKKYSITFYVASTIRDVREGSLDPGYVKEITISQTTSSSIYHYYINLAGKKAEWVKKTIEFQAKAPQETFSFFGTVAQTGRYGYAHMYVDKNSIKQIN